MLKFKHAIAMAMITAASLGAQAADASWWDQFKTFTHQQKNEAVASGKKLIAEADKQIDALKASTKNATAETKAANEKNMKELQEKKKAAQAELAKLEKSGADVWDATKTGFSKAAKDLSDTYDKAAAAVKK